MYVRWVIRSFGSLERARELNRLVGRFLEQRKRNGLRYGENSHVESIGITLKFNIKSVFHSKLNREQHSYRTEQNNHEMDNFKTTFVIRCRSMSGTEIGSGVLKV